MRFRKLWSIAMAAVMACSAVAVAPPAAETVNAAESTKALFEGTKEMTWAENITIGANEFTGYSTATIKVTYSIAAKTTDPQLQVLYAGWTDNKINHKVTSDGVDSFELSAEQLESVQTNGLIIQASEVTITKVELTGEYTEPTFDAWSEKEDGSYSYSKTTASSGIDSLSVTVGKITKADASKITAIKFKTNLDISGKVNIGKTQYDYSKAGEHMILVNGLTADTTLKFDVYWLNKGQTLNISDFQVITSDGTLEKDKLYVQKTALVDEKYSVRYIMMVDEATAKTAENFLLTLGNGAGTATITSTEYYTSVSALGNTITPEQGCVFVAYAITDIPGDTTITVQSSKLTTGA